MRVVSTKWSPTAKSWWPSCKQIRWKQIKVLVNALIVQVEFSGKADRGLVRFRDLPGVGRIRSWREEKNQKKERGHVDFAASHSTHRWRQDSAENEQQEVSLLNLNNLGGKTMRVMVIIKAD